MQTFLQKIAHHIAKSHLLIRGKKLWEDNQKDWLLPLTKYEKLLVGSYIILLHYSEGKFPPTYKNQEETYGNELSFRSSLPGFTQKQVICREMRKPFWFGKICRNYMTDFSFLCKLLEKLHIEPSDSLLELGCGTGWMAEFLALMKFNVTGTTLSPEDIKEAEKRLKSLQMKGVNVNLRFIAAPMETVDEILLGRTQYRCVFMYEALHHAFDWRRALQAAYRCLDEGGWILLCNEPNELHTFIAYRGSVLSNAHEIGFHKNELIRYMKQLKLRNIQVVKGKFDFKIKPLWIVAQK